jgi:hypothetical protein
MPYCDLDSLLGLFANPRTRGGKMCKYSRLYIRKISPSERTRVLIGVIEFGVRRIGKKSQKESRLYSILKPRVDWHWG